MTISEVKKRMFLIKKELLELLKSNSGNILEIDKIVHELYNEYLKLHVMIDDKAPSFSYDWDSIHSSCYYYALNLPTPNIFESVYEKLTGYLFESHLGSIAGLPYLENFTKKEVLEYLYSDLEALKIKWYKSDINELIKHDGSKIALLVDETENDSDFHFVRQNIDGSWSEKDGCGCEVVNLTTKEEFTSDPFYKYVGTLELVRPTIKR